LVSSVTARKLGYTWQRSGSAGSPDNELAIQKDVPRWQIGMFNSLDHGPNCGGADIVTRLPQSR